MKRSVSELITQAIEIAGGTQEALANMIGFSQNAVHAALKRESVSPAMARAIHIATKGRVKKTDLRPDIYG